MLAIVLLLKNFFALISFALDPALDVLLSSTKSLKDQSWKAISLTDPSTISRNKLDGRGT
jgi:hypothetical protein